MTHFNLNFIPRKPGIYLVGGTVRDLLLDRRPQDYDIAAFYPPGLLAEEIARETGGRPVRIGTGRKSIYRIVTPTHTCDVSAGRGEHISDDLAERDFTVNAMAYSPLENRLIDPFDGRRDLESGIIRMVSPAAFTSDPLRLLRAFRMAAGLGFAIEPDTLAAIRNTAAAISETAGERIRDEWLKLLAIPDSIHFVEQMDKTGLLEAIFPEVLPMKGCIQVPHIRHDLFSHSMAVFRQTEQVIEKNHPALLPDRPNADLLRNPADPALIKHAALFHDIGKPAVRTVTPDGAVRFHGQGKTGAETAAAISERLRMSNLAKGYVDTLIHHHRQPFSLFLAHSRKGLGRRALAKFFVQTRGVCPDLILLSTADMLGKGCEQNASDFLDFARRLLQSYMSDYLPAAGMPPLISGTDLIQRFGIPPSPFFSKILRRIELGRLAGTIRTREEAFAEIKKILHFQNRS